ncbi:conserved Plasmodium protein, unknown function [Plasmodium gallinaceum]|uniref:Uncharacterized protein n=1 Tax=Plasmodium gallinaceum TaxID=5849 RepID=A0A1J1GZE6_PLAGA|nr:conserved Plasmodium protein, unknown function [Plasmodium gallinaceum]CRG96673.1 conserved Plasmodium protein, unknown function [Plasmodium gallinaceum]
MSTIRWIHRRNKNCEKRIISLNEIKEKYSSDNVKERNIKNSKSSYDKKVYERNKSIKEKDNKKKNFGKFFSTEVRPEEILKNEGIRKNLNIYINKKKINEKDGKENRRKCSSEVYRKFVKEDNEENNINNYINFNDQNEEKQKENVNINLDINIQWDKNNSYEKNKSDNNKDFLKNNINMKYLEDKMKNKYSNLCGKRYPSNASYLSDSFIQRDEKNRYNRKEEEKIQKEFHLDNGENKKIYFDKNKLKHNYNEKETKYCYYNNKEERYYHFDEERYNCYEEKCNHYNEKKLKHYDKTKYKYYDEERQYVHYNEENDYYHSDKEKKYNYYDEEEKFNHPNEEKLKHYNEKREYDIYDEEKKRYYNENKYYNYDIEKINNYKDEEKKYYYNHNSEDKYYNTCINKENKYENIHREEEKYYNEENKKYYNIEKGKEIYKKDARKKFSNYEQKKVYNHKDLENFSHKYKMNKIYNFTKEDKSHINTENKLKKNFVEFSHNSSDYIKKKNYIKISNEDKNLYNLKYSNRYLTTYEKIDRIILSTNLLNKFFLYKFNIYFFLFKDFFLKSNRPIFKKYNKIWDQVIPIFKNEENNLLVKKNIEKNYKSDFNEATKLYTQETLINNKNHKKEEDVIFSNIDREKIKTKREEPYKNILNKKKNEAKTLDANVVHKEEQTKDKRMIHKNINYIKNLYKNKVLNNTLIDSFNDVDLNDQRRKKKYLKFFVILLSLFLKKYMYKQFSKFFFIIGSLSRKHVEKREIRKYINMKIYSLSLLETILNKKKKEISILFFNELKRINKNSKKDMQDKNSKLNFTKILTKKYKSKKNFENLCFGKPKIYGTDDFTIYYKKKILKEKDEIFQKCLLRSKSDSLLDFLKYSRINKFSRKLSKNLSKNFSFVINDDIKSSNLLERFYTATYNLNSNSLNKNIYKSKFHLSYYENINDNNFKYTNIQNINNYSNKKKQIYMNFKKKDYEIISNNIDSNSLLDNTSEHSVDERKEINSFINISKEIKDSSDEDINDKNCRIFFKNLKKKLKINYKKTVAINNKDEDLSLSDLNSTIGLSKNDKTHLFDNSQINLHDNSITNLNFLTNSDLCLINNFPGKFSK